MGYLANFMVYTLAMVGVIVVALLIFKSTTSQGIGSKSKYLKIIKKQQLCMEKLLSEDEKEREIGRQMMKEIEEEEETIKKEFSELTKLEHTQEDQEEIEQTNDELSRVQEDINELPIKEEEMSKTSNEEIKHQLAVLKEGFKDLGE